MKSYPVFLIGLALCLLLTSCANRPDFRSMLGLSTDSEEFRQFLGTVSGDQELIGDRVVVQESGLVFHYDRSSKIIERIDIWIRDRFDAEMRPYRISNRSFVRLQLVEGKVVRLTEGNGRTILEPILGSEFRPFGNGYIMENPTIGVSAVYLPSQGFNHSHGEGGYGIELEFISLYEPVQSRSKLDASSVYELVSDVVGDEDLLKKEDAPDSAYSSTGNVCSRASDDQIQRCNILLSMYSQMAGAEAQIYGERAAVQRVIKQLRSESPQCARLIENGCIAF